jgi:hypothetical protein
MDLMGGGQLQRSLIAVTGVLAVDENRFLQVLEGKRGIVEQVCQRLKHDPRHYDLEIIWGAPIMWRAFPDWTVAFAKPEYQVEQRSRGEKIEHFSARQLLKRAQNVRQTGRLCEVEDLVSSYK